MRAIKAKTVYDLIKDACREQNIPFTKGGYRRAKRAYNQLSRPRRHLVA